MNYIYMITILGTLSVSVIVKEIIMIELALASDKVKANAITKRHLQEHLVSLIALSIFILLQHYLIWNILGVDEVLRLIQEKSAGELLVMTYLLFFVSMLLLISHLGKERENGRTFYN